jgi:hypothetical protein
MDLGGLFSRLLLYPPRLRGGYIDRPQSVPPGVHGRNRRRSRGGYVVLSKEKKPAAVDDGRTWPRLR